jgi:hypothetical protein
MCGENMIFVQEFPFNNYLVEYLGSLFGGCYKVNWETMFEQSFATTFRFPNSELLQDQPRNNVSILREHIEKALVWNLVPETQL